jgi:hypothetical protein
MNVPKKKKKKKEKKKKKKYPKRTMNWWTFQAKWRGPQGTITQPDTSQTHWAHMEHTHGRIRGVASDFERINDRVDISDDIGDCGVDCVWFQPLRHRDAGHGAP